MIFPISFAVIVALFNLANSSPIGARTTACFTKHTGQFLVDPGSPVGANPGLELIWPAAGRIINVSIQECPDLPGTNNDAAFNGRIIAVPDAQLGISSNQCLTAVPTGEKNLLDISIAACGDNDKPPSSQQWYLEQNDFGHVITFAGQCSQGSGFPVDDSGNPITDSDHLLQVGCIDVVGEAFGTFTLSGYSD